MDVPDNFQKVAAPQALGKQEFDSRHESGSTMTDRPSGDLTILLRDERVSRHHQIPAHHSVTLLGNSFNRVYRLATVAGDIHPADRRLALPNRGRYPLRDFADSATLRSRHVQVAAPRTDAGW